MALIYPSCSGRLSVVFVTYYQITQHCSVNSHCRESIKYCAVGSFACHWCSVSYASLYCMWYVWTSPVPCRVSANHRQEPVSTAFCLHGLSFRYVLRLFFFFSFFDVLPWFSSIVSYPWGVRILVLKREQKTGLRNCVSCHFLVKRLKPTEWNSTCFIWL